MLGMKLQHSIAIERLSIFLLVHTPEVSLYPAFIDSRSLFQVRKKPLQLFFAHSASTVSRSCAECTSKTKCLQPSLLAAWLDKVMKNEACGECYLGSFWVLRLFIMFTVRCWRYEKQSRTSRHNYQCIHIGVIFGILLKKCYGTCGKTREVLHTTDG